MKSIMLGAALAAALTLASATAGADECEDVVATLKKHGDAIMKTDPKPQARLCAAMGQLLGIIQAIRIVAEECYDEGKERDALMKEMAESSRAMEQGIDNDCK
jgi:hypothetical protein